MTDLLSYAGQGPAKTRLVFPESLAEVLGNGTTYTYGPAFIQFNGANWLDAQTLLASVTAVSSRSADSVLQAQHAHTLCVTCSTTSM